tara:strand:+ start:33 stop:272 length:240 start_codon:yes stop_codon:yes gene_type:complete
MTEDDGIEGDIKFIGEQYDLEMESLKADIGEAKPINKRRLSRERSKQRAEIMRMNPDYRSGLVERVGEEEVARFEKKYG